MYTIMVHLCVSNEERRLTIVCVFMNNSRVSKVS